MIIKKNYDLVFIVAGELLGKNILTHLKKNNSKLIFLCLDNPFYNMDKNKWLLTLNGLKLYDLIIFQQRTRIKYAKKLKLKYPYIRLSDHTRILNLSLDDQTVFLNPQNKDKLQWKTTLKKSR